MASQTRQLAELLTGAGASVVVVQTNRPYRPSWVARLRAVRAAFRLVPYLLTLWRAAARADLFHVMANSGLAWHLFSTPAVWIASLRGVPVVVNYRGGEAGAFLERAAAIVRYTVRRCAVVAVPSGFLQQIFARHGMSTAVLPNIVDVTRYRPRPERRALGAHIVVIRNLEPLYDNASAIRALAIVRLARPDARLTIAGGGPQLASLQALARELGVAEAVDFPGPLDREGVAQLLRAADVCLNPSVVDNMPNSVLEALAAGVPVVSTRVGGIPFIVEHGRTALLVDPRDAGAMAEAVLRVLGDADLWQSLSAAGLAQARSFTWEAVAPRLADLYRQARTPR